MAVVERDELVGRSADPGLIAVSDVRDDEQHDELDAGRAPQAFPEPAGAVLARRMKSWLWRSRSCGLLSIPVDVDHCLAKCLGRFLRQVVADAIQDAV